MKRLLLAILTIGFIGGNAMGQTFVTQHDTVNVTATSNSFMAIHNVISSTSSDWVKIQWRIIDHNLPAAWINDDLGVCDNVACYGSVYFSNLATQNDSVKAGTNVDLKLQLKPANATGTYYVTVSLKDNPQTISKTVTYIINKWTTNVNNVRAEDNINIYPNPAKEALNVVFDDRSGVKNIAVYNLIGKVVSVFKVSGNSAKLDLVDVPAGIYFVRLLNAQGQIVATRKFTHQ